MSFLQPAFLLALPIMLLPIIIHLINQRRFQTVHWAAMQFLLAANRISQGYAKIRRWLILAARVAAIAALVFAISRPLSSGVLAVAGGGRIDTAIVLLDRSPSMTMRTTGNQTKLELGLQKIVDSLDTLAPNHIVLIDSTNVQPIGVDSADQLSRLPQASASAKSADIPAMIQVAYDYIVANRPSRCDIWICSDIRRHDWNPDNGAWPTVTESIQKLPQTISFRLLSNTATSEVNRSVRVAAVRPVEHEGQSHLSLSLAIFGGSSPDSSKPISAESVSVQLELNGARSEMVANVGGTDDRLQNLLVPIDGAQKKGWGALTIAPDSLTADNQFFFVYDRPIERKTVIVADQGTATEPIEFATSVSPSADIRCSYQRIVPAAWIGMELTDVALVVWHAPIPAGKDPAHQLLQNFVNRGGQILFLPPASPTVDPFADIHWTQWRQHPTGMIQSWVGDEDLLGRTLQGGALPVGELRINRFCGLTGDHVPLARLDDDVTWLTRAADGNRNVYFCSTTVSDVDSSLAENGIVLYAMIQRLLEKGVKSIGAARMQIAGELTADQSQHWRQVAGDRNVLSTEYINQAGVYEDDDRWIAVNRSVAEDQQTVLDERAVADLFSGLDFRRVEIDNGSRASIVQEIWRLCLVLMLAALIAESALSIPRRTQAFGQKPTIAASA